MTTVNTPTSALVRDHIERGLGLTREMYLSPSLFEQEMSGIFGRSWQCVGHVSQLAEPHQYLAVELGTASVVVTRTATGDLRAFHNVCRHRGSRIVDTGCGKARRFVCPYHQWAYGPDGQLLGTPKMGPAFDTQDFPLLPVHVQTWQGLVFVNLADHPGAPVDGLLAPAEAIIATFDLAKARVAHTERYHVAANWKIVWENAQECYHCAANHPEFLRAVELSPLADDDYTATAIRRSDDGRVQSIRFPLRGDAVSLTMDGRPASGRPMGRFADGEQPYTASAHLKPSVAMVCSPDYAMVMVERPVSVRATEVIVSWLVHGDAREGVDYDLANLIKVWDATNQQDWELCERAQLGVDSPAYRPGPVAPEEAAVGGFHHAYAVMLAEAAL